MSVSAVYARRQAVDMDALVAQHAPLVKRIAYHLAARLPKNIQPSDLIQAGMIGLIEAARHYDPNQGASFETYAGIRIRGAILDEVRRGDWAPRSVHRRAREMAAAVQRIENTKGGEATDSEIATAMDMSLDEYFGMLQDISGHRVLSFDDVSVDEEVAVGSSESDLDPSEHMAQEEVQADLAAHIAGLPEREQMVLSLYYKEELNLKEIGEVLGVTESRVCQIHSQALVRLRARLTSDGSGETGGTPDVRRKPRIARGVKA